jgi:branched-chain amino acid transport system substrate-binding protein
LSTYKYVSEKRALLAKELKGDIEVAVDWNNPYFGKKFMQGVSYGLDEENAKGFTFTKGDSQIQRKMRIYTFNDHPDYINEMAKEINANKNIIAVLDALGSAEAVNQSVVMEKNGIVSISTRASDPSLTNHGFKYVFSTLPVSREFAKALVDFCERRKFEKIAILYARQGEGGLLLSGDFTDLIHNKNINVTFVRSFDTRESDYRNLIHELQQKPFDAIILAAKGEAAGRMIKQLRKMGIEKPIMSNMGLDDTAIWKFSEKKAYNTFVASVFDDAKNSVNLETDEFYNGFKKKFDEYPNDVARQGYDAIRILAAAIRKSNSAVPASIAGTLRFNFKGEYLNYYFDKDGRIVNKNIFIKEMKDGLFYKE